MEKGVQALLQHAIVAGTAMVVFGTSAFGDLYSGWGSYRDYAMNSSGAGITTSLVNFPVLVRLTSADSMIFGGPTTPVDLRFAKGANRNVSYPYQVERWNATARLAEIWVLVDTVFPGSTSQSFRMYWGNSAAAAQSSGGAVFNAANGFMSVWHLQDTTDACGLLPLTGATKPTQTAAGIIGVADSFDGATQYLYTADSTSANAMALNFPNGGPFTLSAWVQTIDTLTERAIVDKGNYNWELKQTQPVGHIQIDQFESATGWSWCETPGALDTGWHYVVGVRTMAGTSPTYAESVYVDGVFDSGQVSSSTSTNDSEFSHAVAIGNRPEGGSYYWSGKIDEVEIANIGRSRDWIMLSYFNQRAGQTFITGSAITAVFPAGEKLAKTDFAITGSAISYYLETQGQVEITFFDALGRTALSLNRTQSPGHYSIELKNCNLLPGQYIVRFKAAGIERNAPVILTK